MFGEFPMLVEDKLQLNPGQQAAANGFFDFLFSPDREMILSGAAGVGKTFVMGYLIDRIMPQYFHSCELMGIKPAYDSVIMTATTNKAAEVLSLAAKRPTQTVHSFLGLKVKEDLTTGRSKLTKTNAWTVHQRKIIFVDECSMIDRTLRALLLEATLDCKIVYVGDHSQLAPVMEELSPIYLQNLPFFELTQPMRNAEQPALIALCQQLRETVETGVFNPIQVVPGVIDHLNDFEMEQMINQTFLQQTRDTRILCYTNQRVVDYNDYIRNLRNLPGEYGVGEFLVNTQAILVHGNMLRVEDELEIVSQSSDTQKMVIDEVSAGPVEVEYRPSTLRTRLGIELPLVPIPINREHYAALLRYYGRQKDWLKYFTLKNTFPDLRPRDAATVHKSQGSTYETVFLDLSNISTCHQPNVAARMLYVAFSRARSRIILYGNLAEKYGGVAQ